jgi:DNA repair protein SbcD/Mre11
MPIKILATADLHLGKSSADVSAETTSTKFTWNVLVNRAIEEDVDIIALCGDIIDRNNRYFEVIGPLQAGIDRLRENGIAVYLVSGNHDFDVLPQVVRKYNTDDSVKLLGKNGNWEIVTFSKAGQTIQFAGWSFPSQYFNESPLLNFPLAAIDPNFPVIGLLHGDIEDKTSRYAPFRLNELLRAPVDLWILGHIHKPGNYSAEKPLVWYTGSPHALSAKEPGQHGPILFIIDGNTIAAKRIFLSPVRYETLDIDVTGTKDEEQVRDRIRDSLEKDAIQREELEHVSFLVYQLRIVGEHAKIREVEHWASRVTDLEIHLDRNILLKIRKVDFFLRPLLDDLKELSGQASPAGILADTILAINEGRNTDFLDKLLLLWRQRTAAVNEAGVYLPLVGEERLVDLEETSGKAYLERECNRLLGELRNQLR